MSVPPIQVHSTPDVYTCGLGGLEGPPHMNVPWSWGVWGPSLVFSQTQERGGSSSWESSVHSCALHCGQVYNLLKPQSPCKWITYSGQL